MERFQSVTMNVDINTGRYIDKLLAVQKAIQLKRNFFTHRALSRTGRSHDTIELESSQAKRESKKGNLQNNDVTLFQFLGFYVLNLKKWAPKEVPRGLSLVLSFRIGFSPVNQQCYHSVSQFLVGKTNILTHDYR